MSSSPPTRGPVAGPVPGEAARTSLRNSPSMGALRERWHPGPWTDRSNPGGRRRPLAPQIAYFARRCRRRAGGTFRETRGPMRTFLAVLALAACGGDPADVPPHVDGTGGSTTASTGSTVGTGGTGGGTGGTSTGGGGSAGVPLFVAQGHLGRTVISCDGGQSWTADQSNDAEAQCWSGPDDEPDCDHDPGAGRGIVFADGWFVATFGWGPPGGIVRSRDGVAWE